MGDCLFNGAIYSLGASFVQFIMPNQFHFLVPIACGIASFNTLLSTKNPQSCLLELLQIYDRDKKIYIEDTRGHITELNRDHSIKIFGANPKVTVDNNNNKSTTDVEFDNVTNTNI